VSWRAGLGLALVKILADSHGGEAKAKSDGEGRGSTFTISASLRVNDRGLAREGEKEARNPLLLETTFGRQFSAKPLGAQVEGHG
jgi:hypothetical protein